jgi:hypothetical protein
VQIERFQGVTLDFRLKKISGAPCPDGSGAGTSDRMRDKQKRGIAHKMSLTFISDFLQ